jgi:hypothetical protein
MAEKKWNISPKTWLRTGGNILPSIDGDISENFWDPILKRSK